MQMQDNQQQNNINANTLNMPIQMKEFIEVLTQIYCGTPPQMLLLQQQQQAKSNAMKEVSGNIASLNEHRVGAAQAIV